MKRVLVTGCQGQLGNELQLLAKEEDEDEFCFFFTDKPELNITNRKAVYTFVETQRINLIVNCAAYTAVDRAEDDEPLAALLNDTAAGYLAEAIDSVGGTMIHVSTDYVFDGRASIPYKEDAPTCPRTVYGRTKLAGEESVIRQNAGAMVVRTSWLYSTTGNNFVKTMLRLGHEREEIGVVADQIGTPTYARDLARFLMHALRQGIVPGVYHFSNEGACSWFDFARAIYRGAGITNCHVAPLHTEDYPARAERPHFSVLDKTKVKQTYGIDIPWWEDSLYDCLDAMR